MCGIFGIIGLTLGLQRHIAEHVNKTQNHSTQLFRFLSVEIWLPIFIDEQENNHASE